MISSLIIGIGGIVFLMLAWVAVQALWRKIFAENIQDDDVLTGRTKCSSCGCGTICRESGKLKTEMDIQ